MRRRMSRWDWFVDLAARETDECVPWPFGAGKNGYGQVQKPGVGKRYTHREALSLRQPMPPHSAQTRRWEAAHNCHDRRCMNYRHLRWATVFENQMDRVKDGTSNRGERHGNARYSEAAVAAIKADLAAGARGRDIARAYGMSEQQVCNIKKGRAWASV